MGYGAKNKVIGKEKGEIKGRKEKFKEGVEWTGMAGKKCTTRKNGRKERRESSEQDK